MTPESQRIAIDMTPKWIRVTHEHPVARIDGTFLEQGGSNASPTVLAVAGFNGQAWLRHVNA